MCLGHELSNLGPISCVGRRSQEGREIKKLSVNTKWLSVNTKRFGSGLACEFVLAV